MTDQDVTLGSEQGTFLATKLYIPRAHSKLVLRPSLIEKLNAFHEYKMTLVSAPAGFGKTTLLMQWIDQLDEPVAWLSLDEKDNDPYVFLQYLIAALQSVDAALGETALRELQTSKKHSLAAVLIPLLNDISVRDNDLCLILDDYHCIESADIHEMLGFMLGHLPPQLHLILSTRSDPPLPLAKMRARNNLCEMRINELYFVKEDIDFFLNEIMELGLSQEEVVTLEQRTEGWAAGLQLAAISLKGSDDMSGFIKLFSGDNRYVADYLVEEVLNKQDEQVHDFLLRTSFLRQMSAELCDSILGRDDSQSILENLEQQNLFIVSLDSKRKWFRYHHLFADLLYQRLKQHAPQIISHLRRQASKWHENNCYLDIAIDYAVAADDNKKAGELISIFSKNVWEHGKRTRLFHWFSQLPVDYIRKNLDLSFLHAWVLFENGQFAEAEQSLGTAEQIIDSQIGTFETGDTSYPFELREIRGKVKAVRALLGTGHGDAQRIMDYAQEALECLPVESSTWRAIACFSLGLAHSIDGNNSYAVELFSKAREESKLTGDMDLYFRASYWLIGRLKYAGKLQEAINTCQDLLRYAKDRKLENTLVWGGTCVFWGDLLYERNQLDEAHRFINKEIEMIERGHDVGRKGWGYYCLMRVLAAKGEIAGAEDIIAKMEELQISSNFPGWIIQLTESFKARMWLNKGELDKVEEWLDQNEIGVTCSIQSLQYLGYMILARYLLAQGKTKEAKVVLEPLISKQQKTKRILLLIETLLIKAFVLKRAGDDKGVVLTLVEALKLAEGGGYIRVFLDEGPPLTKLLEMVLESDTEAPQSFVRKLLTASLIHTHQTDISASAKNEDSLSERELEVLRLIAAGLSNKKITEKLFISISTVKTHLRNIYSKLNAHSRTEAVARANELHLL